jgi:hypothetical protein
VLSTLKVTAAELVADAVAVCPAVLEVASDQADHLAAVISGLASLTVGAAQFMNSGRVRQQIVELLAAAPGRFRFLR